jgi:uncharacterized protein
MTFTKLPPLCYLNEFPDKKRMFVDKGYLDGYNDSCLLEVSIMRLKWKDIAVKKGKVTVQEQIELSPLLKGTKDILSTEPLVIDLAAEYINGLVDVRGTLHTDLTLHCSRCLKTFSFHLDIPFQELYSNLPTNSEKDEEIHTVTGDEIDLQPEVEQNFLLAIPYIPVCKEDCQGLCPVCGINRNLTSCECKQEKLDPRLAGLADFFKN